MNTIPKGKGSLRTTACLQRCLQSVYNVVYSMFTEYLKRCLHCVDNVIYTLFTACLRCCLQRCLQRCLQCGLQRGLQREFVWISLARVAVNGISYSPCPH